MNDPTFVDVPEQLDVTYSDAKHMALADPNERLEWRPEFELRGLGSLPVVF